jgi:hypothetical protein
VRGDTRQYLSPYEGHSLFVSPSGRLIHARLLLPGAATREVRLRYVAAGFGDASPDLRVVGLLDHHPAVASKSMMEIWAYTDWWNAPRLITDVEADSARYAEDREDVFLFFAELVVPGPDDPDPHQEIH